MYRLWKVLIRCSSMNYCTVKASRVLGNRSEKNIWRTYDHVFRRLYPTVSTAQFAVGDIEEKSSVFSNSRMLKDLQSINTSVNKFNRVKKSSLINVLDRIHFQAHLLGDDSWILLLKCCGNLLPDEVPSVRIKLAHRIWEVLKSSGIELNVNHHNALLSCYLENRHKISATEFLKSMGQVEPNELTYHLLLECICEDGDVEAAGKIILNMKSKNLPVNERLFNALLKCHAKLGDIKNCQIVSEMMQTAQIPKSADSFTALLEGFCEIGDITTIRKIFSDITKSGIELNEKQALNILRKLAISSDAQLFSEVLRLMPKGIIDMTSNLINTVIHLVHLGKVESGYLLLEAVPHDSVLIAKEESQCFGNFLIEEVVKTNNSTTVILNVCDSFEKSGRNQFALLKAAEAALKYGKTETAVALFWRIKSQNMPVRTHYFWPLFVMAANKHGEKGVFDVLKLMKKFDVNPDSDTLIDYVLPHCSLTDPLSLVRKLQDNGLKLSVLMGPLLNVILKSGQLQSALKLCNSLKFKTDCNLLIQSLVVSYFHTRDLKTLTELVTILMKCCDNDVDIAGKFLLEVMTSKSGKLDAAELYDIIKFFKRNGLSVSPLSADSIYYQLQLCPGTLRERNDIIYDLVNPDVNASLPRQLQNTHPRDMTLFELECHLVELKSKNMNTRGVLRRLLQLYCSGGDAEKALEIKKEFETGGYEFSPGMYAALFDLHVKCGQLDEAENYLATLLTKFKNFKLDEHKVVDFAALLVSDNRLEEALQILQRFGTSTHIKGGSGISRNCWRLLNSIVDRKDPQNTKKMLKKLVELGYCSESNVLLGPIIRSYLMCDDLHSAVMEYEQFARNNRMTPLQHELLCQLVQNEKDRPLLKRVIKATEAVHGSDSTFVSLLASVAEAGTVNQLRQVLSDKNIKWHLLIKRCKRFAEEGKLVPLNNIANACEGIVNFNVSSIYTLIMKVYCRLGDCQNAVSLWTTLQDKNIVPEEEFLNDFASLLQSNKLEVPFQIPKSNKYHSN